MSFVYSATSPTVHIYFMQLISTQVLAAANLLNIGLAALVNSTIKSARELYHRYFLPIIIADVTCFWIVSLSSIEYPVVRFLGFAIINAISVTLWTVIMKDSINSVLNGTSLTEWSALSEAFELYGAFLGGIIAVFCSNLDVELCISFQCIANMMMGITDFVAYKELRKER